MSSLELFSLLKAPRLEGQLDERSELNVITPTGVVRVPLVAVYEYNNTSILERLETLETIIENGGGGGSSGTWGIPRTMEVGGVVTGTATFDGSRDFTLTLQFTENAIQPSNVQGLTTWMSNVDQALQILSESTGGGGGEGPGLDLNNVFTQEEPAIEWRITHAMGKIPSVTVLDTGGEVIYPHVKYESPFVIVLMFSEPMAGKASLN